ncbi:PIN domain nuclease [bacterium]|nr:PIN domain nuclease [bacterium]
MIMVDSSVWIDYFNGASTPKTDFLDSTLGKEPLVIGDLIQIEVLQGFQRDSDFRTAKKLLDLLPFVSMGGDVIAMESIKNFRFLRKRGVTVRKTIDVIIGSYCIFHNLYLLYEDKDFDPMAKFLKLKTVVL